MGGYIKPSKKVRGSDICQAQEPKSRAGNYLSCTTGKSQRKKIFGIRIFRMGHFLIFKTLQRMCELQGRLLVFWL